MTTTKYIARLAGKIVGTRKSTIPPACKTYTHAIVVSGHGKCGEVVAWCSRPDLAQGEQRKYQRYGYRAEIAQAEIVTPKAKITQAQVDTHIAKVQQAEAGGQITALELEAHLDAIAKELRSAERASDMPWENE